MARWTELKDFRDDCRSAQASGGSFSTACEEALRKELEPPPYAPSSYFSRLGRRGFHATEAKKRVYQVVIEMGRVAGICRRGLLRGGNLLLVGVRSLESIKAVTRVVLQAWWNTTSAAECVGISRATVTVWTNKSRSCMTSIIRSACLLLVAVWDKARILRPLIMPASQWARHQTTEFAHYAQPLSKALSPWFQGLSLFSKNYNIHKLVSFCLHPWTFDSALLLLSTAQRFQYHNITDLQYVLFINILLVHHLILWPFWCNDFHRAWWRIITLLSDLACCALTFIRRNYKKHFVDGEWRAYSTNMAAAMIGIELEYELLLLVNGLHRSFTTFGILFATAIFSTIFSLYTRRCNNLYDLLGVVSVVLFAHVIETCVIIYCSVLGRGWRLISPWLLKCVKVSFWIFYGIDVWAMFTLSLKVDLRLHSTRG